MDNMNMTKKELAFTILGKQVYNLKKVVKEALFELMPENDDEIRIWEDKISEDYTFYDYDGRLFFFVGFKRAGAYISLLGKRNNKVEVVHFYQFDDAYLLSFVEAYRDMMILFDDEINED